MKDYTVLISEPLAFHTQKTTVDLRVTPIQTASSPGVFGEEIYVQNRKGTNDTLTWRYMGHILFSFDEFDLKDDLSDNIFFNLTYRSLECCIKRNLQSIVIFLDLKNQEKRKKFFNLNKQKSFSAKYIEDGIIHALDKIHVEYLQSIQLPSLHIILVVHKDFVDSLTDKVIKLSEKFP